MVHFSVAYHTHWGEHLEVRIAPQKRGGKAISLSLEPSPSGDEWHGHAPLSPAMQYTYEYAVKRLGGDAVREVAFPQRRICLSPAEDGELWMRDTWRWDVNQQLYDHALLSALLCPFVRAAKSGNHTPCNARLHLIINAIAPACIRIMAVGSDDKMGRWQAGRGIEMRLEAPYTYTAEMPLPERDTEYKYVAISPIGEVWESGYNRMLHLPVAKSQAPGALPTVECHDGWIRIESLSTWRAAGIVVPLFSLRSRRSEGIGDFCDLKKMVAWAADTGMHAVQLLPINDTLTSGSRRDSYPYNIVSAFALNPIYINLAHAGYRGRALNDDDLGGIEFEAVCRRKMHALRELYAKKGKDVESSAAYKRFASREASWLDGYSRYRALSEVYATSDFRKWPDQFRRYNAGAKVGSRVESKERFWKFVQFVAFTQMATARRYARRHGVLLKGDIPIGVSPTSCEVWQHPELFNTDMSTGAPPDYFSADGQNWGFPTYRWQQMRRERYAWWKARLGVMSQFFDAYRIDHVLGFFRIWEIPRIFTSARYGHFSPSLPYSREELLAKGFEPLPAHEGTLLLRDPRRPELLHPAFSSMDTPEYAALDEPQKRAFSAVWHEFYGERNEQLWHREATERLTMLRNASPMLPCAEDLGLLPHCVESVLSSAGILSLEIQSMPKQQGVEFADPRLYPYRSVATLTTHDMPSLRLWWKRYPDAARRYAINMLGVDCKEATPEACSEAVRRQLYSPSMLCMLSLQDWTAINQHTRAENVDAEQINDPSNPNQYWNYRMHLSIEELSACKDFTVQIRNLICNAGRNFDGSFVSVKNNCII